MNTVNSYETPYMTIVILFYESYNFYINSMIFLRILKFMIPLKDFSHDMTFL